MAIFCKGEINESWAALEDFRINLLALYAHRCPKRDQVKMKSTKRTSVNVGIDFVNVMPSGI